jgi:hypothetical protein
MNKHQQYESQKQAWLHLHPDATPEEIEQALKRLAKALGV